MREIICTGCPAVYAESEIVATSADAQMEPTTLAAVLGVGEETTPKTQGRSKAIRRLRSSVGPPPPPLPSPLERSVVTRQREALNNIERLRDWEFSCPKGHRVEGNRGRQLPIGVLGPSGSSKSHFLPGLLWETEVLQALHPWSVRLEAGRFTMPDLEAAKVTVYRNGQQLPSTPPTKVIGPFGYRVAVGPSRPSEDYLLILYDVGGEALSQVRVSETRLLSSFCPRRCASLSIPSIFCPPRSTLTASRPAPGSDSSRPPTSAGVSSQVVNALEEIWGRSAARYPRPDLLRHRQGRLHRLEA